MHEVVVTLPDRDMDVHCSLRHQGQIELTANHVPPGALPLPRIASNSLHREDNNKEIKGILTSRHDVRDKIREELDKNSMGGVVKDRR